MKAMTPTFTFEDHCDENTLVAGIDEVGRGALAGPLTVGLVIFAPQTVEDKQIILDTGIHDSKLLSPQRRELIVTRIKELAFFTALSYMSASDINVKGISPCLATAMIQLMDLAKTHCPDKKIAFLVDGNPLPHIPYEYQSQCTFIVKGDMKSISIAAASILAKVDRDQYMTDLAKDYAPYGWDINKGYGTLVHRNAITQYGPTPHHRTLYIRKTLALG